MRRRTPPPTKTWRRGRWGAGAGAGGVDGQVGAHGRSGAVAGGRWALHVHRVRAGGELSASAGFGVACRQSHRGLGYCVSLHNKSHATTYGGHTQAALCGVARREGAARPLSWAALLCKRLGCGCLN